MVEERAGLARERSCQQDIIRLGQQLIELRWTKNHVCSFASLFRMLPQSNNSHAESLGKTNTFTSNGTQPNHPQSCSCNFSRTECTSPQILLSPMLLHLITGCKMQSFR